MRWTDIKHEPCSIARTLSVIGDRWTLLIIRNAFLGVRRFDDFQAQLGVTRHLLTDRLNLLVDEEILHKIPYQEKPTRYEYKLTRKGRELYPVLMTLVQWGDKWMAGENGPPIEYFDRESGAKIEPILVDQQSGKPITPYDTEVRMGAGIINLLDNPDLRERWSVLLKRSEP